MQSIRIKYYGIPLTKRAYLVATAVCGIVAVLLLAAAIGKGLLPPPEWPPWEQRPVMVGPSLAAWIVNHVYAILLVLIVLRGTDILVALRRFTRMETEQRSQLSENDNLH